MKTTVVRPAGWDAQKYEDTLVLTRPGHLYRGITKVEYDATLGAGLPIHSTGAYSFSHEGTNFGEDFSTAEAYVDGGRDDPRKTGRPNYVVEILPGDLDIVRNRHGEYWAFEPVPLSHVTRVWRMEEQDDAVVAVELVGSGMEANMAVETSPDRLVREYGGEVMRFDELPVPAQLSAARYMAIDGEAWELPEDWDYEFDDSLPPEERAKRLAAAFRPTLPHFREEYGDTKWGYVVVPMDALIEAVMKTPDLAERFDSFDAYHEWYGKRDVPSYTKRAPWPVILGGDDDEVIQDGWHRFHRYYDLGLKKVPAIYYPNEPEENPSTKKLKARLLR